MDNYGLSLLVRKICRRFSLPDGVALTQVVLHVVGILEGLGALWAGHRVGRHRVPGANVFGQVEPGDESKAVGAGHAAACNRDRQHWCQLRYKIVQPI